MRSLPQLLLITVMILQSCHSTKRELDTDSGKTAPKMTSLVKDSMTKVLEERMKKEGYEIGIVKYLENSDCSYVILNDTTQKKLDAINFDSNEFSEFKENGLRIFFKYKPLRMMNRCTEAAPIVLISVFKK
jgi:hypothetical protein